MPKNSNMGYMDRSGTTYFSSPPYINDSLNNINLYLSKSIKNNNKMEDIKTNENILKLSNKNINKGFSDILVSKNNIIVNCIIHIYLLKICNYQCTKYTVMSIAKVN